ncbi:hypothetical protein EIP91_004779 [Steccherinum ochraceum]|uniref:Uncharacterized protein n=1 Tax=Steccherinum ochraceum TaxID=92696 RepID=A0A4R0R858_9APHY|nr:hypothetical protein EIP91_004779 [Steccherinum ochraceum]
MRFSTLLACVLATAATCIAAVPRFYGAPGGLAARNDNHLDLFLRNLATRDDYAKLVLRDVLESIHARDYSHVLQARTRPVGAPASTGTGTLSRSGQAQLKLVQNPTEEMNKLNTQTVRGGKGGVIHVPTVKYPEGEEAKIEGGDS